MLVSYTYTSELVCETVVKTVENHGMTGISWTGIHPILINKSSFDYFILNYLMNCLKINVFIEYVPEL